LRNTFTSEILYIAYDKYKKEKICVGFCFIYCDKLFWDTALYTVNVGNQLKNYKV